MKKIKFKTISRLIIKKVVPKSMVMTRNHRAKMSQDDFLLHRIMVEKERVINLVLSFVYSVTREL